MGGEQARGEEVEPRVRSPKPRSATHAGNQDTRLARQCLREAVGGSAALPRLDLRPLTPEQ